MASYDDIPEEQMKAFDEKYKLVFDEFNGKHGIKIIDGIYIKQKKRETSLDIGILITHTTYLDEQLRADIQKVAGENIDIHYNWVK